MDNFLKEDVEGGSPNILDLLYLEVAETSNYRSLYTYYLDNGKLKSIDPIDKLQKWKDWSECLY